MKFSMICLVVIKVNYETSEWSYKNLRHENDKITDAAWRVSCLGCGLQTDLGRV